MSIPPSKPKGKEGDPDIPENKDKEGIPDLPGNIAVINGQALKNERDQGAHEEQTARANESGEIDGIQTALKGGPDANQEIKKREGEILEKSKKTFKYVESFLNPDTSNVIASIRSPLQKLHELANSHSPRMIRRIETLSMEHMQPLSRVMNDAFEKATSLNLELKTAEELTPQIIDSISEGLNQIIELTFKSKQALGAADSILTKIKREVEEDARRGYIDWSMVEEITTNADSLTSIVQSMARKSTHNLEALITEIDTIKTMKILSTTKKDNS